VLFSSYLRPGNFGDSDQTLDVQSQEQNVKSAFWERVD
jgi:hypothetical protein